MQKTIDMTPTWTAASRMLILAFESGSADAKEIAKAELLRMGQLLDQYAHNDRLGAIADGQEGS